MAAVLQVPQCPPTPVWRPFPPVAMRRPTAAQFRRRRVVAGLAVSVLLGGGAGLGALGGVPLTSPGPAPAADAVAAALPVAASAYLVAPGDTLWGIARKLQPAGDVRPLVQQLAAGRQGAPLQAGERLVLPAGCGTGRCVP